ncbi:MAG: CHAD domain-containing protein [Opitutaceae bacterium]
MRYRLRRKEQIGAGLQRVCIEQLDDTCTLLARGGHDAATLHEARKRLKKIRAALDLASPAFARVSRSESASIQKIARMLGPYRETDALAALLEREARIAGSTDFDFLETSLRLHQIADRGPGDRARDLEVAQQTLLAVRERIAALEVEEAPEGLFLRRFRKTYKAARDGALHLPDRHNGESLHAFRKAGKRLLNQAWLLATRGGDELAAFRNKLVRLDDLLGRSRDCANLAAILRGVPAAEAPLLHGLGLRVRLERVADETQTEAARLGRRIYRRPFREFMARALKRVDR